VRYVTCDRSDRDRVLRIAPVVEAERRRADGRLDELLMAVEQLRSLWGR
jgi:hypothetical protein